MRFQAECVETTSNKVVKLAEHGRSFIVENTKSRCFKKVRIDSCIIKNIPNQPACDYGVWIEIDSDTLAYLIELKGKNIPHACEQIVSTINYIARNHQEEMPNEFIAAMVVSKYHAPKLKNSSVYIELKRKVKDIKIKEQQLKVSI